MPSHCTMDDLYLLPKSNKRLRKANYSSYAVDILVSEVTARQALLFGRSNFSSNNGQKYKEWEKITKRLNTVCETQRSVGEIRKKWHTCCSDVKRKVVQRRVQATTPHDGDKVEFTPRDKKVFDIVCSVDNVSLSRAGVGNFDNVAHSAGVANFENGVLSAGIANFDRDNVSAEESGLTMLTPKRELDPDDCFVVSSPSSEQTPVARNLVSHSDTSKSGDLEITDVRTEATVTTDLIPPVNKGSSPVHPIIVFPHNGALTNGMKSTPTMPLEGATKLSESSDKQRLVLVSHPRSVPLTVTQESHGDRAIKNASPWQTVPLPRELGIVERKPDAYARAHPRVNGDRSSPVDQVSSPLPPVMVIPSNTDARHCVAATVLLGGRTKLSQYEDAQCRVRTSPPCASVPAIHELRDDHAINDASPKLETIERTPDVSTQAAVNGNHSLPVHDPSFPTPVPRNTDASTSTPAEGATMPLPSSHDRQQHHLHVERGDFAMERERLAIDRKRLAIYVSTQAAVNGNHSLPVHDASFPTPVPHNTDASTSTPAEGATMPLPSSHDRQQHVERGDFAMERERLAIDRKRLAIEEGLLEVKRQRLEVEGRKVRLAEELLRQGRHRGTSHALYSLLGGLLK